MSINERGGWIAGAAAAGVITTVALLAPRPVAVVLAVALALAAVAGAGAALPEPALPDPASRPGAARPWRSMLLLGCAFAAAIASPTGLTDNSGPAHLAAAATLGASGGLTSWAWTRLRRPTTGVPSTPRPAAPAPQEPRLAVARPLVTALETLTVAGLCTQWRRSYLELRLAERLHTRAQLAELRRCYLEEMARRDPAGFAAWLAHDPYPAAGHPERYLRDPSERRSRRGRPDPTTPAA